MSSKAAIVFGISGEQGQYVAHGLLNDGTYDKVYGVTHSIQDHRVDIERFLGVDVVLPGDDRATDCDGGVVGTYLHLLEADLSSGTSLKSVFRSVKGSSVDIFLVTTTDLPPTDSTEASLHDCEEREYQTIKVFFDVLKDVHVQQWNDGDQVERHVVFSTLENVRGLVEWLEAHDTDEQLAILPSEDGGIVPHYTGKGRGGEYALSLVHGVPNPWETNDLDSTLYSSKAVPSVIPGLSVTLITLPFLHSNFTASAVPLPTICASSRQPTQWSIEACLGDSSHKMDMLSVSDLQYIVPILFREPMQYQGRNIRLSAEKITMDQVAWQFADLFGKDVVYSPLTVDEIEKMDVPGAESFAQMCQYLSSEWGKRGDVELTKDIMEKAKRVPQTFQDWLLTHSDDAAFEKVGLTVDAKPILCVAVFNATCMQGKSVIKGLLADQRKEYTIRACICNGNEEESDAQSQALISLDPDRITVHNADQDDVTSCANAMTGAEGVFVVTDFYNRHLPHMAINDPEREEQEEKRARNLIDACAAAGTVRHLVFSTLESAEDVDKELQDEDGWVVLDEEEARSGRMLFDSKVRMAAYARSKGLSVTYVLMPVYSEEFFHVLATQFRDGNADVILEENYPSDEEEGCKRVVCMSVEELGGAVANIMDAYEVYAGHEIALMTDILSLKEASGIIKDVFFETKSATVTVHDGALQPSVTVIDTSSWTSIQNEPEVEYKRLDTFARDLGSMFSYLNRSQAVKRRQTIAKTMELVPDVRTFRQWLEDNRDNVEFRSMLGIR